MMTRPTYPHTLQDIVHAVDGAFGLVVGDLPDGRIWVLKRDRKTGHFSLRQFEGPRRREQLAEQHFDDRTKAIHAMARELGLSV